MNASNPGRHGRPQRNPGAAEAAHRQTQAQAGLAVVLVGHNPASEVYVRSKIKTCGEIGIFSDKLTPPETVTTEEMLAVIADLNRRPDIDGILVQMPLPKQVDTRRVLESVAPDKDADGFHPVNVGHLVAGRPAPRACTPAGIMELLKHYQIPVDGRRAVVLGRSDIVGKPMALMLLHENATVTICHSRTSELADECHRADILVAAIGRAGDGDRRIPGSRRDGDRRRHESRDRSRGGGTAGQGRGVRPQGLGPGGRRSSPGSGSRGFGVYARAGRRGSPDHRHADGEHRGARRAASGR